LKFCQGKQDITPCLSPCNGTANSLTWCCGETTDCCQTGNGVIALQQVFGRLLSSVSTPLPTATTISTAGSSSSPGVQGPRKLSAGAIAGITVGAAVGLAIVVAGILLRRKGSRRKQTIKVQPTLIEAPHNAAMHEIGANTVYAQCREVPGRSGLLPGELQGDAPAVSPRSASK